MGLPTALSASLTHLKKRLHVRVTYTDADKELIEVNLTITVGIEEGHELVGLGAGNADLDLAKARVELFGIDLVVAVEGVEVSEGSAEASDGLGTTGLDLFTNSLEDCA